MEHGASFGTADEGISELMMQSDQPLSETLVPASLSPSGGSGEIVGGGQECQLPDCGSISEGYATSLDSLTSSETISLTSETEQTCDSASDDPFLRVDSLTLALRELSCGGNAHQVGKAAPPAATTATAASAAVQRPAKKLGPGRKQRSSSMKTQKTPPGTPNQMKKVVRFADAFGLDLAYVKHVFDTQNPPVIPPQAMHDLNLPADELPSALPAAPRRPGCEGAPQQRRLLLISPCFAQPGSCANFVPRVLAQKVVLERASVSAPQNDIHGVVRVSNIGFEKSVLARVTFDGWRTSHDVIATYVRNSSNGSTDQFAFSVELPSHFGIGDRVVICVRYCVSGETFWDNNFGDNYSFDCFAVNSASDASGASWTHFL